MKLFPLLIPALVTAALLAGCATPEGAIRARTELATLAKIEAKAAASETDAMAAKLASIEESTVRNAKIKEYNEALAKTTTPEQGAALGYNYALDMAEIDANAIAEAKQLGATGAKVRVLGKAAEVLNEMADEEGKLAADTAALLWDEALPALIKIGEDWQSKLAADEAARVAKLEADAKASADEKAREDEHTEAPAEPVTPPAVTTGS